MSGAFTSYFHTGASEAETVELILEGLNDAAGTAYNIVPGSIKWCENYAFARMIWSVWQANQMLQNQFNPQTMGLFLPKWEEVMNLHPLPTDSISDRKKAVAALFRRVLQPPTLQGVRDRLSEILGPAFVDLILGASAISNADIQHLNIRTWVPYDVAGNQIYSPAFLAQNESRANALMRDYLPAYMTYDVCQYNFTGDGLITMSAGANGVLGTGTSFTTDEIVLDITEIQLVDDTGALETFTIHTITDDTHLNVVQSAPHSVTNKIYQLSGFYLDTDANLDTEIFDS